MWQRLSQRLTDPVTYRKHGRSLIRPFRPPRQPRPVTLDALGQGPVLAVFAHPDDEIFASGLICELGKRGVPVEIACVTRGEGGITGGHAESETLGKIRESELRASAAVLGVRRVTFLDHIDPPGKSHRVYPPKVSLMDLALQIGAIAKATRPSAFITHGSGGEYWHPAHLLTHRAVLLATREALPVFTIHAWQPGHSLPNMLNRDDPADLVLDARPHHDKRLAALRAHRTQAAYFEKLGGGSLEGYLDRTPEEAHRSILPTDFQSTRAATCTR